MAMRTTMIREFSKQLGRSLRSLGALWRPRVQRELRLCESLALGDRRFLSVVEFGSQRLLLGGTGTSLALLAVLPGQTLPKANQFTEATQDVPLWRFVHGELMPDSESKWGVE